MIMPALIVGIHGPILLSMGKAWLVGQTALTGAG